MTISDRNGMTIIDAAEGKALRPKGSDEPSRSTQVALGPTDSADRWEECEHAQTEDESEAGAKDS